MISSDDASASLDGDRDLALEADPGGATFSLPLPGPEAASALLRLPAASVLGMYTPRDCSSLYHVAISILSSVGLQQQQPHNLVQANWHAWCQGVDEVARGWVDA
jgi:hypothetical protein